MKKIITGFVLTAVLFWAAPPAVQAKTAKEIDASVDAALDRFIEEVEGGQELLNKAAGVLVFPRIFKGGFVIGGEYGEGALRIPGQSPGYFNAIGGSLGFQLGAGFRDVYFLFMDAKALKEFQTDDGWRFGANAGVTLIKIGLEESIDTLKTNEPILAFVLGQRGLMYDLNFEGMKFNKLDKS